MIARRENKCSVRHRVWIIVVAVLLYAFLIIALTAKKVRESKNSGVRLRAQATGDDASHCRCSKGGKWCHENRANCDQCHGHWCTNESDGEISLFGPNKLPGILLAGTQKSGSTAVAYFLQRAGVCLSRPDPTDEEQKEVHYFDTHDYKKGVGFYSKMFSHCENLSFAADATPGNFRYPKRVKEIYQSAGKETLEELKIVIAVREPVARELSWYNHRANLCRENVNHSSSCSKLYKDDGWGMHLLTFSEYADSLNSTKSWQRGTHPGQYGNLFEQWFEYFNRKQILVLSYDELKKNETTFLQRIVSFLDIDVDSALIDSGTEQENSQSSPFKIKYPSCNAQEKLSKTFFSSNEKFFKLMDEGHEGPAMEQKPFPRFELSRCTTEELPQLNDLSQNNFLPIGLETSSSNNNLMANTDNNSTKDITVPGIILAGVQKSGSTAVAYFLQRAGICLSRPVLNEEKQKKEVHYFDKDREYAKGIHFYSEKFAHCENLTFTADGTPDTFRFPKRVKETYDLAGEEALDKLKVVIVVREPVARELSWYNHRANKCRDNINGSSSCPKIYTQDESVMRLSTFSEYADNVVKSYGWETRTHAGLYGDLFEQWFECFDRKQILVLSYDELKQNETSFLQRVFSFIGLETDSALIESGTGQKNTQSSPLKMAYPPCGAQDRLSKAFSPSNEKFFRLMDEGDEGPPMEQRPFPRFELSKCATEDEKSPMKDSSRVNFLSFDLGGSGLKLMPMEISENNSTKEELGQRVVSPVGEEINLGRVPGNHKNPKEWILQKIEEIISINDWPDFAFSGYQNSQTHKLWAKSELDAVIELNKYDNLATGCSVTTNDVPDSANSYTSVWCKEWYSADQVLGFTYLPTYRGGMSDGKAHFEGARAVLEQLYPTKDNIDSSSFVFAVWGLGTGQTISWTTGNNYHPAMNRTARPKPETLMSRVISNNLSAQPVNHTHEILVDIPASLESKNISLGSDQDLKGELPFWMVLSGHIWSNPNISHDDIREIYKHFFSHQVLPAIARGDLPKPNAMVFSGGQQEHFGIAQLLREILAEEGIESVEAYPGGIHCGIARLAYQKDIVKCDFADETKGIHDRIITPDSYKDAMHSVQTVRVHPRVVCFIDDNDEYSSSCQSVETTNTNANYDDSTFSIPLQPMLDPKGGNSVSDDVLVKYIYADETDQCKLSDSYYETPAAPPTCNDLHSLPFRFGPSEDERMSGIKHIYPSLHQTEYLARGGFRSVWTVKSLLDHNSQEEGHEDRLVLRSIRLDRDWDSFHIDQSRRDILISDRAGSPAMPLKSNVIPVFQNCALASIVPFSKGGTLDKRVTRRTKHGDLLSAEEQFSYAMQAAKGVHQVQLYKNGHPTNVHADVQPGQFLLFDNPEENGLPILQLNDFNRGKFLTHNITNPNQTCPFRMCDAVHVHGPKYRSPEELMECADQTAAIDVFALGGVFYYLLSDGKKPWYHLSDYKDRGAEVWLNGDIPRLPLIEEYGDEEVVVEWVRTRSKHPAFVALSEIMKKCWAVVPDDRPTSLELVEMLEKKWSEISSQNTND